MTFDRRFVKGLIQLADPKIWLMSYLPATLGLILAALSGAVFGYLDILWIAATYAALGLIETGKNAVNEYVDYKSGVDPGVDEEHLTDFSGGKKTVTQGLLSLPQVVLISVSTLLAAVGIGLAMVLFKRPEIIYVGVFGIVMSVLYSIPPFRLCYKGLGEITVGITFGTVLFGAYFLFKGTLDLLPVLVAVPVGITIANILLINEFPDYEADKNGGKKNLVVRLGKKQSCVIYGMLFILVYVGYAAVAIYAKNPVWLAPYLTIPLAYKDYSNCVKYYADIPKLIKSNAGTVQLYIINCLLLAVAAILQHFFF
ncbi:MAG: prenyltransferase [Eubacteriales bacterium]